MKVDFDQRLIDLDGKAFPFNKKPIAHLKDIVAHALLVDNAEGEGDEMHARYKLAKRVKQGGEIVIDDDNLKRIKGCMAATCSTIAVGIVYDILDAASAATSTGFAFSPGKATGLSETTSGGAIPGEAQKLE